MKRIVSVFCIVVILTLSLVSCGLSKKIIGDWNMTEDGVTVTYSFDEDGKFEGKMAGVALVSGTYEVDGNEVTLTIEMFGQTSTETLKYEDGKLVGDGVTLTKAEK
jgi:uncharacterized protein (TIGR03066 family)